MEVPDFITTEFLEKLLQDNIRDSSIEVIDFDIIFPVPKGANYLSKILEIDIEYKHKEDVKSISLIAKLPLKDTFLAPLVKGGINEKEVNAYNQLLPKINEIINIYEVDVAIIPKSFHTDVPNTLFIENLSVFGYKMTNKVIQLDYDHSAIVLKNLAKFHAASVKLHEMTPHIVEELGTDHVICRDADPEIRSILEPMMGEMHMEMVCKEFEKWPETKKFLDFLLKLKPKIWDVYLDAIYPGEDEFCVLNHGDLWTNNILFKYDRKSKPKSVKFLDFQILRYTSPTMDLINFFYTSIRYDVLKTHYNNFAKMYLDNLNLYLEIYGCSKRLPEEDFNISLQKRGIFALIQCVNALPFVLAEYDFTDNEEGSEEATKEIPLTSFLQNELFRTVCVKHLEDFSKTSWYRNFK